VSVLNLASRINGNTWAVLDKSFSSVLPLAVATEVKLQIKTLHAYLH